MNKFLFSSQNAALRATIIEGKGECQPEKLAEFQDIMRNLWTELSDLADFDKVCSNFSASFRRWQQISLSFIAFRGLSDVATSQLLKYVLKPRKEICLLT